MKYKITLIPGDGTGPEIAEATKNCILATGVDIEWDIQNAGADVMEQKGTPLPDSVLESIRKNKVALKGPITTPIGTGFRSVNVALRQQLDLFACVRPCKTYEGIKTKFTGKLDIVIVRENTEDLYAGIEFKKDEKNTLELIKYLNNMSKTQIRVDSGISIKPISVTGTERIVKYAFEYARKNNRKKVTAVNKANIMKHTDGLFLEVAKEVAKKYNDVGFDSALVDNLAMQLIKSPERYDVLVLPNLYGDIISDLCAGLIGGLGVAPGANIGDNMALFEAVHGSAPKYKGLNKVNPSALIFSGVLMLRYIKEEKKADILEKALAEVIKENKFVTYDLKSINDVDKAVGTKEMAEAIIKKVGELL
jgi:isocitrate dehydrogenase (NAD+)